MVSPSLFINRIVVDGDLTLDLSFRRGLNIVQSVRTGDDPKSTNASGKTTLVELIQHGLGRRQTASKYYLSNIMNRLNTLWLEVEMNGYVLTIERSLRQVHAAALVRDTPYVRGIQSIPADFVPIDALSDYLLQRLQIPKVAVKKADGALDYLTFPVLMRTFILHQEDSFGSILDKIIPDRRRTDILGFISRITPLGSYTIEERLAELQQQLEEQETRYNSVHSYLRARGVPSLAIAGERVEEANRVLSIARQAQYAVQTQIQEQTESVQTEPGRLEMLRSQMLAAQHEAAIKEREFIAVQQEDVRLTELLASLQQDKKKAGRLLASRMILSSVDFVTCPRCLLDITAEMRQREQYARCSLCNRPLRTTSDAPPRFVSKLEDIQLQIDEVEQVLRNVHEDLDRLAQELAHIRNVIAEIGIAIDYESRAYVAPALDQLLARSEDVSRRERELYEAQRIYEHAQELELMSERLNALREQQAELQNEAQELKQADRQKLNLLRDIYEQVLKAVEFPNFQSCTIDPNTLMPNINGRPYTSVGTALKGLATVCFHLALLQYALRTDSYFPSMLVIDSPAVGDLNDENHDKLLHYFAKIQSEEEVDERNPIEEPNWQIMLTTRRMVPPLERYINMTISAPAQRLLRERQQTLPF